MNTFTRMALVVVCLVSPVVAVMPPSTSMAEDKDAATPAARDRAFDRRDHTALERLEEDTRRLEDVLRNLREDQQDLDPSASAKRGSHEPKNP